MIVVVHATWSRSESCAPPTRFGRNFLRFTIDATERNGRSANTNDQLSQTPDVYTLTADGSEGSVIHSIRLTEDNRDEMPFLALSHVWKAALGSNSSTSMLFVLPAEDGYIVKNDFIEEMFRNCDISQSVQGFVAPGQRCAVPKPGSSLLALLRASVGVVVAKDGAGLGELEDEVENRLSWPWVVDEPVKPSRIAIFKEKRSPGRLPEFHQIAKACGVSLVVFDSPGHWMEDDDGPGGSLREHFVPFTDYTYENLPQRVVEEIQALPYRIDGIMTTVDALFPPIARAAELLGLKTLPSSAYRRAGDKYETRLLSPAPTSIKITDLTQFESDLRSRTQPLSYPLIVKPTNSHGSEGASRVDNDAELMEALEFAFGSLDKQQKALKLEYEEAPVIVETYCEGPEVDVNFVFWEGELLFSEVTDNFPCSGDGPPAGRVKAEHFGATGSVFPSGLPQTEIEMVKRDVLAIVRKLGVDSGVVHAEAKVHKSAVEWHTDANGVQDLQPRRRAADDQEDASTFLLEVNVRFPGTPDMTGSYYVNGILYSPLFILHAIGDEARFRSLAHGFLKKPLYHYAYTPLVLTTPTRGIMPDSLSLEKAGLEDFYAMHWQYWKGGDLVPPAKERPYPGLGYIVWRSRRSRQELMEKVSDARHKLDIQLV